MQLTSYLTGLNHTSFEGINGIKVVERPEIPDAVYYISTYSNFEANSKRLLAKYRQLGHNPVYQFHHLVEERHLKIFYNDSERKELYKNIWPCVLLDTTVHQPFSWMFNSLDPFDVLRSSRKTSGSLAKSERPEYIQTLMKFYAANYSGNRVFQKIAFNVLNELYQ